MTSTGDPINYIHVQQLQEPDVSSPIHDSYNSEAYSNIQGSLIYPSRERIAGTALLNQAVPSKAEKVAFLYHTFPFRQICWYRCFILLLLATHDIVPTYSVHVQ